MVSPTRFSHNLLLGLPREYSSRLLAKAPVIFVKQGKALFEIGAAADGCYYLEHGVLKVSIASPEGGAERIVAILGPGAIVGELAMIDGLPSSATVQALRDCKLTFLTISAFLECLQEDPNIHSHLVTTLVERLRQTDEELAAASFLTLEARVARALLQFAKYLGEPGDTPDQVIIPQRIRQDDLAALAHVARENVSRILSMWRKRKVIEQSSASIYIIHKTRLEREAARLSV